MSEPKITQTLGAFFLSSGVETNIKATLPDDMQRIPQMTPRMTAIESVMGSRCPNLATMS